MPWGPRIKRVNARIIQASDDHWLWTGHITPNGYGRLGHDLAHRLVYEMYIGPIPPGLQLDHLCRVRHCVNPSHLEIVTHAENVRRGNSGDHNRSKTHCPAGHPYDEANTHWYLTHKRRTWARRCRECHRANNARQREARRDRQRVVL